MNESQIKKFLPSAKPYVNCPHCGREVERVGIDDHVRSHSQSYYHAQLAQGHRQRFHFHTLGAGERAALSRNDVSKRPILFTDPVYFDEAFAILHQMRGPLFTRFTADKLELDTHRVEWRLVFKLQHVRFYATDAGDFAWRCPLCSYKTPRYEDALQAIFLALCHLLGEMRAAAIGDGANGDGLEVLVKRERGAKVEPLLGDEDLALAVQDEWLNFNRTAGISLHGVAPVDPYPVRIFDDYMPQREEDKRFIQQFFNRSHRGLQRGAECTYFCAQCFKLFDSAVPYVGHMDVAHQLKMELRLFPVDERRVVGGELCNLTPHWFPLLVVATTPPNELFRWDCFHCHDRMSIESSDLLLVLIKAMLHLYFEAYSIYAGLNTSWPALVQFCVYIAEELRLAGPASAISSVPATTSGVLSLPVRLLLPLVHRSALPHFPTEFQQAYLSKCKPGGEVEPENMRMGRTGNMIQLKKGLAAMRMDPHESSVHYCLQCELHLGTTIGPTKSSHHQLASAGSGVVGKHRCCKKEEEGLDANVDGVRGGGSTMDNGDANVDGGERVAGQEDGSLAGLLRKVHLSITSEGTTASQQRDYELDERLGQGINRTKLKRKRK